MKIWLIFWKTLYIFYAVLLQSGARCHTQLVKPVRLQPHCWLVLWKQLHLPHTNTNVQDEQRQTFSLCRLYASADPALIQQTKLSLLNAQQKSSLAVIMHPPRPAAPQSTVLPAPPRHPPTSPSTTLYITQIVYTDQRQQRLVWVLWGLHGSDFASLSRGCLIGLRPAEFWGQVGTLSALSCSWDENVLRVPSSAFISALTVFLVTLSPFSWLYLYFWLLPLPVLDSFALAGLILGEWNKGEETVEQEELMGSKLQGRSNKRNTGGKHGAKTLRKPVRTMTTHVLI